MADLATLAEVKARLELGDVDPVRDALLSAWLLAVQNRVLELTGFSLDAATKTDQLTNVQQGRVFTLKYRPVVSATARARYMGPNATLASVPVDVTDPQNGKVVVVSDDLGATAWPPSEGVASWYRWRAPIWPVVVFTYSVSAVPAELLPVLGRAVVEWVAWIWAVKPQGGRLQSFSAEKISESYQNFELKGTWPPIVGALLGPYVRGTTALVF